MNLIDAISINISGTVPERETELKRLWNEYSPQFEITSDKLGYNIQAGFGKIITFNQRTLYQIWILGFASWCGFEAFAPPIFLSNLFGLPIEESFKVNDQINAEENYKKSIKHVSKLNSLEELTHFDWPNDVPHPKDFDATNFKYKAIFDLTVMSASFIFLHEIRHVQIAQESKKFNPFEEELNCDSFALEFIIGKIDEYSKKSGYSQIKVLSKRATSIVLVIHLLLMQTPTDKWGGSSSHPALSDRIKNVLNKINLPSNDSFWLYLSSILLSQLRINNLSPTSLECQSYKHFCIELTDKLNEF